MIFDEIDPQSFKAGVRIFQDGEEAGDVYFIYKGKIEITKIIDGKEVLLAELGENSIFGEMAMIDNSPRSATAKAIEDTWCYVLDKDTFKSQIESLSPFMREIYSYLASRIRKNNEKIGENNA